MSAVIIADFTRLFSTGSPKRGEIDCTVTIYSVVPTAP
jgi:hypothetical protein